MPSFRERDNSGGATKKVFMNIQNSNNKMISSGHVTLHRGGSFDSGEGARGIQNDNLSNIVKGSNL